MKYIDDNTLMIAFPLKQVVLKQKSSRLKRRDANQWWSSLDLFEETPCTGIFCSKDGLSGPGDIVVEASGRVVFTDQKRIYAFSEPEYGKAITLKSIELPGSVDYVYRQRTHMVKTSNGSFISNNDTGIYLARFEEYGEDEVVQLKKHGRQYWKHSNDMATNNEAGLTWATEGKKLLAFSHADQTVVYRFPYTNAKISGRAAISVLGDVVLVSTPVRSNDQRKLEVSAFLSTAPESSRLLWRSQFEPDQKESLNCRPEMALSNDNVFLLCNQDILVLDVHSGQTKFQARQRSETQPLKGLVIDKDGRFFTQGEKALYLFDAEFRSSVYIYPQAVTPAEGLLLAEGGTLIAPAVIHNETPFVASPEFFNQDSSSGSTDRAVNTNQTTPARQSNTTTRPVTIGQPEMKPTLRLHKFRVENGTLSLISQEDMVLRSTIIPPHFKNDKTGRPFWVVGAPVLSNSGNLYLFAASISRRECNSGGVPCTCFWLGTDMVVKHTLNKGLDKTAIWAKKYQNSDNTNFLTYHGSPFAPASTPAITMPTSNYGGEQGDTAKNYHSGEAVNRYSIARLLVTVYISARMLPF
ncbi:hypothetical protein [Endozoicomonas lisbonensis]|uniref:hypothetical protein n=1 Tax=Endozoicomonas lisbonensis TaxID=3120522 RepID=UPI003394ACCB